MTTNMRNPLYLLAIALLTLAPALQAEDAPIVDLETNLGTISVQLNNVKAPITTSNFLTYVNEGFYSNTIFHRVVPNFVVQGGGFTPEMVQKPTHSPILLESNNGLSNLRGTIAMARTSAANSATAQFYINTVDNLLLNYANDPNPGYAVFGKVIEDGMKVVDSISAIPTQGSVPVKAVIIQAARQRLAQLGFSDLHANYSAGEKLQLVLQEDQIKRTRELDLWVAILVNNQLLFVSPENSSLLSTIAKPFKRKVSPSTTTHEILSTTTSKEIAGNYTVFAIFNEVDKDISNLKSSLRSNIANANVQIK